jgi:hypothetical protein
MSRLASVTRGSHGLLDCLSGERIVTPFAIGGPAACAMAGRSHCAHTGTHVIDMHTQTLASAAAPLAGMVSWSLTRCREVWPGWRGAAAHAAVRVRQPRLTQGVTRVRLTESALGGLNSDVKETVSRL